MPNNKRKPSELKSKRASFHEKLTGFDIRINSFGEMESTYKIDQVNQFLNEEVQDKKIRNQKTDEEE